MKIIAVIPARYASTRFPAKLMQDLGGKTVILRTYEAAIATNLFADVFVVTDSDLILNEIISNGGKAIMSTKEHESGSDRIAEAVENMDVDVVINVQGDEPFINKKPLEELIEVFKKDVDKKVDLGSLMFQITDKEEINNPNNVKVITNVATTEIFGEDFTKGLKYKNRADDSISDLNIDGVFIEIGLTPNSEFAKNLVETNRFGEIIINENNMTNVKGVFAAGDVTTVKQKQIVISVGEGAKAALNAFEYLIKEY